MVEAKVRRRDRDQAAEVVRKGRSGRRLVRRVLKRGRKDQRRPHHQHQPVAAEPMVVVVGAVKAPEVSGREKDVEVEPLPEDRLLEVRR